MTHTQEIARAKALKGLQTKLANAFCQEFQIRQTTYGNTIVFRYDDAPQQAGSVAELLIREGNVVLKIPSLNIQAKITFYVLGFLYDEYDCAFLVMEDTEETYETATHMLFGSMIPLR